MARFEYKVIPSPRKPRRAKGMKTVADRFANTLTEEINAQAALGWEFVRSETLPMDEKPGMFKKAIETYQSVIVFRREIEDLGEAVTPISKPVEANSTDEASESLSQAAIAVVPAAVKDIVAAPEKSGEKPGYWD